VPDNLRAFVIAKTEREFGPLETMDHPSGEKSIHDLQQIIREGIAEQERKRAAEEKAKREHDEQMRKMGEQFAKDHPVLAPRSRHASPRWAATAAGVSRSTCARRAASRSQSRARRPCRATALQLRYGDHPDSRNPR
jgi:hypothetical protein